jgi:hypothetical protein
MSPGGFVDLDEAELRQFMGGKGAARYFRATAPEASVALVAEATSGSRSRRHLGRLGVE